MFSTKRLGVLLAALLTGTMAFGIVTSAAWFTDSDSVAVTATSGQININANPVSFSVSNLVPGVWTAPQEVTIFNEPSSTVTVKYRLTDGNYDISDGLFDQLHARVTQRNCGGSIGPVVYNGLLSALYVDHTMSVTPGGLQVNWTHCWLIEFKLDDLAGNAYQNQSAAFDLVFDATQLENPGWSEAGT